MYPPWLSVCLSINYARKMYPFDVKFCTPVEYAKLEGNFENEQNRSINIKLFVVIFDTHYKMM